MALRVEASRPTAQKLSQPDGFAGGASIDPGQIDAVLMDLDPQGHGKPP